MTDDIVTRLQEIANALQGDSYQRFCIFQAADEIERLQAEVARLTLVSSLWESEFVAACDEIKRLAKS